MKKVIVGKLGGIMLALVLAILASPAFTLEVDAANGEIEGSGTEAEPYLIEDAQDLAKMATDVNSGTNAEGYYKLANDIDLSTVCGADVDGGKSWTPIGTSSKKFKGTFDGDGHKITGLYISAGTGYQGLFGCAQSATIKNFILRGDVISTSGNYNAAVLGDGATPLALENIGNEANVNAAGQNTGGVIGRIYYSSGSNSIKYCYNKGNVTASGNNVGGLLGYIAYDPLEIDHCYNTGKISSTTSSQPCAAGLVANAYSSDGLSIASSHNYGEITGTKNNPIVSQYTGSGPLTVTNTYYLEGSGSGDTAAVSKTASEFKSLAKTLGEGWSQGDDYPILPFEYIKGKASVEGATPETQQVTQGDDAEEISITATGDSKLDEAAYTLSYQWYVASESDLSDATAIDGATGTAYIPDIAADMEAGDYYFYCEVTSASTDGSFDDVKTVSSAARVDVVSTIEAATPTVTITKDIEGSSVGQGNTVTFTAKGEVTGDGAGTLSYEWFSSDTKNVDPEKDKKVGTGEIFEFVADDLGDVYIYCVATNTFENVKTANAASDPTKLTVVGKEIATAKELADFADEVNSGNSYEGRKVTLTADIDLSDYDNWTPIGGNNQQTAFKGEFDGGYHAIKGMKITSGTHKGLFGYVQNAYIHDLTISGSVAGTTHLSGTIAVAGGTTKVEKVGANVQVTASSSPSGGVVGQIPTGSNVKIDKCYNKGNVTGKSAGLLAGYVGGIVGQSYNNKACSISSCYNIGDITNQATSASYSYAGGICGNTCAVDNCYNSGQISSGVASNGYERAITGGGTSASQSPICESESFFLDASCANGCGGTNNKVVSKSSIDMKDDSFITTLNTGDYAGTWISGSAVEAGAQDYPGLKWEGKKLTVTYDLNDGTEAKKTATVFKGEKATKPEDPTREGYAFVEWQDADGNAFDFENTAISEDITLTAVWGHTITFNSNGGSEVAAATVKSGEKATAPEEPTRERYTFVQWRDADGNAFDFENTAINEDITLTAAWGFKVTFDSAGGSKVEPIVVAEGERVVEPEEPIREEFFFDGWQLKNKPYDFSSPVNSEMTLTAKWVTLYEIKGQANSAIDEAAKLAKGSEEEGTAVDEETAAKIDREAAAAKAQIDEMTKPNNIAAVTANAVGNILDAAADYAEAKLTEAKKEALQAVLDSIEENKDDLDPVAAAQLAIEAIVAINNASSVEAVNDAKTATSDIVNTMVAEKKAADEKAAADKKAAEEKAAADRKAAEEKKAAAVTAYNNKVKAAKAKKVKGFKVKAKKGKKARATWKKTAGASGYEIYRATKKNGKYKKVKVIKKVGTKAFTNKKLKAKKRYYYKIRPYTMVKNTNGKMIKIYGKYSAVKRIKAKK